MFVLFVQKCVTAIFSSKYSMHLNLLKQQTTLKGQGVTRRGNVLHSSRFDEQFVRKRCKRCAVCVFVPWSLRKEKRSRTVLHVRWISGLQVYTVASKHPVA